jgi:PAS domain S-box-containing protein
VLVVDDNADMRHYVTGLLENDYAVTVAVDGAAALQLARADPPDLVLTDVMMPRLDGFDLLAALRTDPATLHVPVVMLSARSGEEAAAAGLEAGADDYLVKPFTARELRARVRANLELDRVRRVAGELARSRMLLDQAEALAHVGSWELDLSTGGLVASPEYRRIVGDLGEGGDDTPGLPLPSAVVHPDDRTQLRAAIEAAVREELPADVEVRLTRGDADERLVRVRGVLYRDAEGQPAGLRGSIQDVTEQRRAEVAIAAAVAVRESAAREHTIADELQRRLLPAAAPQASRLDVAAYYAAGVEGTQAGGDWYDVIGLGGGRTALVIGDVMGRGVRAAAVMGQLRATVRAYARLDLPPAPLLRLLDAAVADGPEPMIVTCVYAVFDPAAGRMTYGNAGHLPPLLTSPGRASRRLTVGDPPLGSGAYRGHIETLAVAPGARLTLYTDGLVEHRGSDLDVGIDRLAALLDAASVPVEGLPGMVVTDLLPHQPDDDVAVLVAEVAGTPHRSVLLPPTSGPTGVASARRAVAATLAEWGVTGEPADDALLLLSELVTNAVRYARAPIEARVRLDGTHIVLDVADGATELPVMRPLQPGAATGRGLHLVEMLAEQWGVRPTGGGKAVWCAIATA